MNEECFFSLDRLVEFGLGVNIAGQMIRMMNESLSQMYVPGADRPVNRQPDMYYAIIDNHQAGSFSECELSKMASENKISSTTYIWKPGMAAWKMASEIPEVLRIVALTPPVFPK